MLILKQVKVTNYKSIDDSSFVKIEPDTTVLVGKNESGKTAFLEAMHKTLSLEDEKLNYVFDYPRKRFSEYEERMEKSSDTVTEMHYCSTDKILDIISDDFYDREWRPEHFTVGITKKYDDSGNVLKSDILNEKEFIDFWGKKVALNDSVKTLFSESKTLKELFSKSKEMSFDPESEVHKFLQLWKEKTEKGKWDSLLNQYLWTTYLSPQRPKFVYFDDYKLLKGKVNLTALVDRKKKNSLIDEDKPVLALFELAKIDLNKVLDSDGYEETKSRLEAISNRITEKVFKFWKQNSNLEVEIDIRPDPKDIQPYNNGPNLYIRIKNIKHRATVSFDQRSKGFIWFFSFMMWFESIIKNVGHDNIIILLDEPGLSLHAMAQSDFLDYIDSLSEKHQVIYTTHSPFMVQSDRLEKVRIVEDRENGTVISDNLSGKEASSLFPLQAALGYTIAQNLFIGKRNLLVEGPADLLYIQFISSYLEQEGKKHLDSSITIVPVGGLDKLSTFVALLGANDLNIVVLHDLQSKPHQKLADIVKYKLISDRKIINYGQFSTHTPCTECDVEDLLPVKALLDAFIAAFGSKLCGKVPVEASLPMGSRVIARLESWLKKENISLRKGGDFNHFTLAQAYVNKKANKNTLPSGTLKSFEAIFEKVNSLLL